MARVKRVRQASDHPAYKDAATREALTSLFTTLFPNRPDAAFDEAHDGMAIAAHHPGLALQLARTGATVLGTLGWCQRGDLRELVAQVVNRRLGCDYAADSRRANARAAGLEDVQLERIRSGTFDGFDPELRVVIDYVHAVLDGSVSDSQFRQISDRYGDAGAVELTTVISFFAFWALFLNATRPGA